MDKNWADPHNVSPVVQCEKSPLVLGWIWIDTRRFRHIEGSATAIPMKIVFYISSVYIHFYLSDGAHITKTIIRVCVKKISFCHARFILRNFNPNLDDSSLIHFINNKFKLFESKTFIFPRYFTSHFKNQAGQCFSFPSYLTKNFIRQV